MTVLYHFGGHFMFLFFHGLTISDDTFYSQSLHLSICLSASSSLPVCLWLEWWFRAYCEVSNPIQSQTKSRAGWGGSEGRGWWWWERVGEGRVGHGEQRGWETEEIMSFLIARSMLSGARGVLAALPVLYFTCCSHSLSWPTVCPSLSFFIPVFLTTLTVPLQRVSFFMCSFFSPLNNCSTLYKNCGGG